MVSASDGITKSLYLKMKLGPFDTEVKDGFKSEHGEILCICRSSTPHMHAYTKTYFKEEQSTTITSFIY